MSSIVNELRRVLASGASAARLFVTIAVVPDAQPSTKSVLQVLTKARLVDVARASGVGVSPSATKDAQIEALVASRQLRFRDVLQWLGRDELRAACRAHRLDDSSRARPVLAARLLEAHGDVESVPPRALFGATETVRGVPRTGDIVSVRHRQYLVDEVVAPPTDGQSTLVRLTCLDDDNQGRALEVLWELELGARVLRPEAHGLGEPTHLDPPRFFGAYLHALKWNAVSATDARLFQAPFRAGIRVMNHQLTPLKKALELPRANLFIADDVGLGKTIEAGLVLAELHLRQRVDFVLIVCPASVCLQWKGEMEKRFGLPFEVYNRPFVARRRQERGFGVNPWATHHRFIISYQTLRRPEYRDPLLAHLGDRVRKSLLILDEAHTAAPSSPGVYAVDSQVTRVVRDVAPRFENRLFLSATPHNGHSNSFSALLELLDPHRFTRAVEVTSSARETAMVRRLKEDLRRLGTDDQLPERRVVRIDLTRDPSNESWQAEYSGLREPYSVALPSEATHELELSTLLAEYTRLAKTTTRGGRLVFVHLQKRLLSSTEAFHRTLELHARALERHTAAAPQTVSHGDEDDEYGLDDEAQEAELAHEVVAESAELEAPRDRARELLDKMLALSAQARLLPDAKVLALIEWIRRNMCSAVRIGGADRSLSSAERRWSDRRILVFTEYGHTKKWLRRFLSAAIDGTHQADDRILEFHGGMSDEQREDVQRKFNGDPREHPVRILLATDAAREGVNLQGYCADLFHFDIPWNPARMEQRNGRIDRTLQSSPEVRCHYFLYPQRAEDVVLEKLVEKVGVIQRELGSLGAVVMERMDKALAKGIDARTDMLLDQATQLGGKRETVQKELEQQRADFEKLRAEVNDAGKILNASRDVTQFDPALLKDAIDAGLELTGAKKLVSLRGTEDDGDPSWTLPELPDSWQPTVDALRPARARDEAFWEWRKRAPLPVVFRPSSRLDDSRVHLHLAHPFVQRLLSRFRAQGFSSHDLARVTVVRNPYDSLVRVIAFGRLSLFGPGAIRLHDQLVSIAAQWLERDGPEDLKPFAEQADRKALERLEELLAQSPTLDTLGPATQERLRASAGRVFASLWQHIKVEADSLAHAADQKLTARGASEAESLRTIIGTQRSAIEKTLMKRQQITIPFEETDTKSRHQYEQETKHLERRLMDLEREMNTEPREIEALYRVVLRRLEPVGLVYLWPETRG